MHTTPHPTHRTGWRRHMTGALAALALAVPLAAQAVIPATERQALIDFYNATNGDNWASTGLNAANRWKDGSGNFKPAGTECSWYGVGCTPGDANVDTLQLQNLQNVSGTLPNSLGNLTELYALELENLDLTGAIPASIGTLNKLTRLFLGGNKLTGPVPDLTGMASLQILQLAYNEITGPMPNISGLTNLQHIEIFHNQFSGPLPDLSALNLPALQAFQAYNNQFSGPIPAMNGANLPNLNRYLVNDNRLTGDLPDLSSLPQLYALEIHNNQITGTPFAATALLQLAQSSMLCPNHLQNNASINPGWNTATNSTPWHTGCTPLPSGPIGVTAVPTLSQWSLMLMGLAAAGLGARRLRRKG